MEFSDLERLQHDLSQVKKLSAALDKECQFPEDIGATSLASRLAASGDDSMNDDDRADGEVIFFIIA
jgi:hypothetical protein